eukprot:13907499-Heterocapsa_arctica.AAC.1
MKDAAMAKYDKYLLIETSQIANKQNHLGVIIFDCLIGGPNAVTHNKNIFNLKENSKHRWVPWSKLMHFISDPIVWGTCSDQDFWDIIVGTRHNQLNHFSFMVKV